MQGSTALGFGLSFFVTLFSVLNPVHAVPLYLAMVPAPTAAMTQRVAVIAALTVFTALMVALAWSRSPACAGTRRRARGRKADWR